MKDSVFTAELTGDFFLRNFLSNLPKQVTTSFVTKQLSAMGAIGTKAARSATKVGPTGNLKRSIGFKAVRATRGKEKRYGIIGARLGGNYKGYHAHLYAEGHRPSGKYFFGKSNVKGHGQWIQKAVSNALPQINRMFENDYKKFLERAIKQYENKIKIKF